MPLRHVPISKSCRDFPTVRHAIEQINQRANKFLATPVGAAPKIEVEIRASINAAINAGNCWIRYPDCWLPTEPLRKPSERSEGQSQISGDKAGSYTWLSYCSCCSCRFPSFSCFSSAFPLPCLECYNACRTTLRIRVVPHHGFPISLKKTEQYD